MMSLNDQIKDTLEQIKMVKGVENVVLTQRDGNPIQSAGVWLSKDEIFGVCSAASAIYNVGAHLHPNELKYILLEGKKSKILIAPLKDPDPDSPADKIIKMQGLNDLIDDFFIAISTQPQINLGGIFLQTRETLKKVKKILVTSGENFAPPLREFNEKSLQSAIAGFNVKDDVQEKRVLSRNSFFVSKEIAENVSVVLKNFAKNVSNLRNTIITINGGFILSYLEKCNDANNDIESEAAMSFSLFSTSDRCAWLLKKMHVESILLECENYFQFINRIEDGIFTSKIMKGQQKIGLLRLVLPHYIDLIKKNIEKARSIPKTMPVFDPKQLLGQLVFN
jgi:predicted regulator of Ras-like GTPase activity (Roadblock/LC7/MglB family)